MAREQETISLLQEIKQLIKNSVRNTVGASLYTTSFGDVGTFAFSLPARTHSLAYHPINGTVYFLPVSNWSGSTIPFVNAGGMVLFSAGKVGPHDLSTACFYVRDTGSGTTLSLWITSCPA